MSYSSQDICNIQVRIKCCYAEASVQFIEAKSLGDLDDAACWRKKLLSLESLYNAFCQYWPIIEEGDEEIQEIAISGVISPAVIKPITIDNVQVSDAVTEKASAQTLSEKLADNMNSRASSRDNDVQVRATASTNVAGSKVSMRIRYTDSFRTEDGNVNVVVSGSNVTLLKSQVQNATAFTDTDDHYCLNEEELQGLIDNFNALCGCGCGKNMFTDQLPKYLRQ